MDIGTAKPTDEERMLVPHWGLDLVEPGELFTVADFQRYAKNAIANIQSRGKLPLLVGGTGLYADAVLYSYTFGGPSNPERRTELENMTTEDLVSYCIVNNIQLPENSKNKRHLIRVIERKSISTISKSSLPGGYKVVGLATGMPRLRTRIAERTEQLFDSGVANEATLLGKRYGWNSEAMTGNVYPLLRRYLEDEISLSETKDLFTTADYQLAKRQMTWFRRNPDIMWTTLTEASSYIKSLLASE